MGHIDAIKHYHSLIFTPCNYMYYKTTFMHIWIKKIYSVLNMTQKKDKWIKMQNTPLGWGLAALLVPSGVCWWQGESADRQTAAWPPIQTGLQPWTTGVTDGASTDLSSQSSDWRGWSTIGTDISRSRTRSAQGT